MPFQHAVHPPLPLDRIGTDEEALVHLPPSSVALSAYKICRRFGAAPSDALSETLTLWRELHERARPAQKRDPND